MATSPKAEFVTPLAAELADDVLDRLLHYTRIDTQSAHGVDRSPSTEKQLDLARLLRDELEEIGLDDVRLDEFGYVYGSVPGVEAAPAIGLIAHVEHFARRHRDERQTAGARGLRRRHDRAPRATRAWSSTRRSCRCCRRRSVTTSSPPTGRRCSVPTTRPCGGDHGRGRLPEAQSRAQHAPIRVCFTVDEEVAGGADHLDIDRFGARYAYTLDGSEFGEIEAETLNASKVTVEIRGRWTHPGTAKGQLVNAIKLAADLVAGLPRTRSRPTTKEREGYVHPTRICGGAEEALVEFIVRDHDAAKIAEHLALIQRLADEVCEREPRASIEIAEEEQYQNVGR